MAVYDRDAALTGALRHCYDLPHFVAFCNLAFVDACADFCVVLVSGFNEHTPCTQEIPLYPGTVSIVIVLQGRSAGARWSTGCGHFSPTAGLHGVSSA